MVLLTEAVNDVSSEKSGATKNSGNNTTDRGTTTIS
jgi:hypothetical protein